MVSCLTDFIALGTNSCVFDGINRMGGMDN
jgi:hypothetical protein